MPRYAQSYRKTFFLTPFSQKPPVLLLSPSRRTRQAYPATDASLPVVLTGTHRRKQNTTNKGTPHLLLLLLVNWLSTAHPKPRYSPQSRTQPTLQNPILCQSAQEGNRHHEPNPTNVRKPTTRHAQKRKLGRTKVAARIVQFMCYVPRKTSTQHPLSLKHKLLAQHCLHLIDPHRPDVWE